MWLMLMTLNGSANWGEKETVKVHVEDWQKEGESVHMYVSVIILFFFSCLSPPPFLSLSVDIIGMMIYS